MKRKRNGTRKDASDDYYNYRLRNARINAGYTLKELAEEIGMSWRGIYGYEKLMSYPKREIAVKIAEVLGVPAYELFPKSLRSISSDIRRERLNNNPEEITTEPINGQDFSYEQKHDFVEKDYRQMLKRKLGLLLDQIPFRERMIIQMRFGLGEKSRTLDYVGKIFGIQEEWVRQLEGKAITRLKDIGKKTLVGFLD